MTAASHFVTAISDSHNPHKEPAAHSGAHSSCPSKRPSNFHNVGSSLQLPLPFSDNLGISREVLSERSPLLHVAVEEVPDLLNDALKVCGTGV